MPRLVVLEGANRGAVLRLLPDRNTIGRDVPPDEGVSRVHAEVALEPDGSYSVRDAGSRNGTFLNGVRLDGKYPVAEGDGFRLGGSLVVYRDDEDEASETRSVALGATPAPASAKPRPRASSRTEHRRLVGESEAVRRVSSMIARCAPVDSTVLITGESGTGKELVAEALHHLGPRRHGPFLAVNAATLEPALFESEAFGHERGAFTGAIARRLGKLGFARGGTLFLDELGELPLAAQAKLLRAIEKREFQRVGGAELLTTDARLVAATNRDLGELVREGAFREDLLFRLRVVEIALPPLRERREDIPRLLEHFLAELRPRIGSRARAFSPEAQEVLEAWRFPGNVRELRNLVERCLIFAEGETIGVAELPPELRAVPPPAAGAPLAEGAVRSLADLEREHIARALAAVKGNKTRVAQLLGIDRATLYAKIKRYGLET